MNKKTIILLLILCVGFSYASADMCDSAGESAKAFAFHDYDVNVLFDKSFYIGIPLPIIGPTILGIRSIHKTLPDNLPQSLLNDSCFMAEYQVAIKRERTRKLVIGGTTGSAIGLTLYSFAAFFYLILSLNGMGSVGNHF